MSGNTKQSTGRPVKVMFLERDFTVGGAEKVLANLLESFDRSRVQSSLVILSSPGKMVDELEADDVPVYHSLGRDGFDPLRQLPALIKIIRRERPDIIYTCNYPLTMFVGRLAGLLTGVNTLVVALHTIGYLSNPGRRKTALRLISPFTRKAIAVSEGQKHHYVQTHGLSPSKIEVIYVGIDLLRFSEDVTAASVKVDLGIPENASVVGIVAVLRPEKRHDVFLSMAEKVLSQRRDVYFFIVGDGPERSKLEAIADEKDLRSNMQFLGNRSDVPAVLRTFDVCTLTSDPVVETSPQCLLEAMASSLPIVSTDVGSIKELVVDGVTGYLTHSRDADALAKHVLNLLNDPEKAKEMGRAGRRRVEEHFSKEVMIRRFEDMFERLAKKNG